LIQKLRKFVPSSVRTALSMIIGRQQRYPHTLTIRNLGGHTCRFRASCEMERGRILTLGDEEQFLRAFLGEIRHGDVVFDLGSCLGLYAIPAAHGGAHVTAFEPDPLFRAALKRNIRLNRLEDSITIVDWAVSDRSATASLFTDGLGGVSPSLAKVGERGAVTVHTDSLDNALERFELPRPHVVKMDIEGAEILALRGMKHLLTAPDAPRRIFVELHPAFLPAFGSSPDECMALLESSGYARQAFQARAEQLHCVYAKRP
jgi:FkbM family methyltransferase